MGTDRKDANSNLDPLESMSGGYAPDDETPTHFLGRSETQRVISASRSVGRHGAPPTMKKQQRSKRIARVRVAPGVHVAYELPARAGGSNQEPYEQPGGGKAQTEEPYDTPGSSISDIRSVGADDAGLPQASPAEDALGRGEVPDGPDMMAPEMSVAPDMKLESEQHADDGPMTATTIPPEGIAGYSSRKSAEKFDSWDDENVRKRWNSLGGSHESCSSKMSGKVDDADAYCAALKDRATGTTKWRGKESFLTLAEVERLCPSCAVRMRRAGIKRIAASAILGRTAKDAIYIDPKTGFPSGPGGDLMRMFAARMDETPGEEREDDKEEQVEPDLEDAFAD